MIKKIKRGLLKNNELKKVINNSGWLIFDKICRLGLSLIVSAWVARYLGPNQFGDLAYVLAFLAFFQAVSILGLDNIVVRDIARNVEKSGSIIATVLILRLSIGAIFYIITILLMGFLNGFDSNFIIITAICALSLIFQSSDTIDLWFQSQSESKRTVVVRLITYLFTNGVKIILILNGFSIVYFAAVTALEAGLCAIGLIYSYRKYPATKLKFQFSIGKVLLKESWPYIFSSLSVMVYMRIDQLMIKSFLGTKELGVYAAILPLAMTWTFVVTTLTTSLAPYIARKKNNSEKQYWIALKNIFRLYSLLGWVTCIGVYILTPIVVPILFGDAYTSGIGVLQVLVFVNIFINMGVAQSLWILNEGKSKLAMYRTLFGAAVCVISNILLIPSFGMYGAAYSALLAQFCSTILSNVFISRKILKIQIKSLFLLK
ncbi:flippase [Photobacterium carnosum]|uniref:flippase n=1 Tax=Photobacterium carnosum TaxID=2023717 RepID=UPI001E2CBF85|nr:oligosaccharide flippase family protein [Photobacterium carnosum]